MKARLSKSIVALILFSQIHAYAQPTTISDIKDENIICFSISKLDAFAFKTTPPYKIWKAQQDREGKLKVKKAFLLGNSEMSKDSEEGFLKGFNADLTAKHKLAGTFGSQIDGDFLLTVVSTVEDDGKGSVISRYNCQSVKSGQN